MHKLWKLNGSYLAVPLLALVILIGGCSSEPSDSDAAVDTTTSSVPPTTKLLDITTTSELITTTTEAETTTTQPLPKALDASDLPKPMSPVVVYENVGVYYTVAEEQMSVIGFDAGTGAEIYRLGAHPLGRAGGIPQDMLVDVTTGVFFLTGLGEGVPEESAYLAAYTVETGEELWRFPIFFWTDHLPYLCGLGSICIEDGRYRGTFSIKTGTVQDVVDVPWRTIIGDGVPKEAVGIASFPDSSNRFDILFGSNDFGRTEAWTIPQAEVLAMAGQDVTPNRGYTSILDEDSSVTAVWLGPGEDEYSGAVIGVDRASGSLLWGASGLDPCDWGVTGFRFMVYCGVVDVDDDTIDRIVRLDPLSGEELWSVELPEPTLGESLDVITGVEMLHIAGDPWGQLTLNLETGAIEEAPIAALCVPDHELVEIWWPEVDDRESPRVFNPGSHVSLCDAEGVQLDLDAMVEVLEASDMPLPARGPAVIYNQDRGPYLIWADR